jgi:hypothetical protein
MLFSYQIPSPGFSVSTQLNIGEIIKFRLAISLKSFDLRHLA